MSDLAAQNREHFNKHASSNNNDWEPLIRTIIAELQSRRAWISPALADGADASNNSLRLLDYACGAGTVSKALIPYVSEAVGLDVSDGMVEQYRAAARELGVEHKMHAHVYDLLAAHDDTAAAPIDLTAPAFDLAIISMALHHVADPAALLARFAALLRPGGACVVLDMVAAHESADVERGLVDAAVKKIVSKHGFSKDEMVGLYAQAGLGGFEYVAFEKPFEAVMHGQPIKIPAFICRGEKS